MVQQPINKTFISESLSQAFYESIPDLIAIIPSILYKDSKEEAEKAEKVEKPAEKSVEDEDEDIAPDDEEVEEVNLEEEEDLQEAINLSNRYRPKLHYANLGRIYQGMEGRGINHFRIPPKKGGIGD